MKLVMDAMWDALNDVAPSEFSDEDLQRHIALIEQALGIDALTPLERQMVVAALQRREVSA